MTRELSCFLGILFECKNTTLKMNWSEYINDINDQNLMRDCKLHSTRWNGYKQIKQQGRIYRQYFIGKLLVVIYIMIAMRPDICYTVMRLSQDLVKLTTIHLMTKTFYVIWKLQ